MCLNFITFMFTISNERTLSKKRTNMWTCSPPLTLCVTNRQQQNTLPTVPQCHRLILYATDTTLYSHSQCSLNFHTNLTLFINLIIQPIFASSFPLNISKYKLQQFVHCKIIITQLFLPLLLELLPLLKCGYVLH